MGAWRIEWTRSGGFAGLPRTASVASGDLGADEARTYERLLDGLDLDALAERPPPRRGADRFQHDLVVERDGHRRAFTVFDGDVPPELRPLLERLGQRPRASS